MEDINTFIENFHKIEVVHEKQFEKKEREQTTEYNTLMKTLKTIKDERNEFKETFSKNLRRITTYKHSIYNLCTNNDELPPALPISHEHHRQTIAFLSQAIDFTNRIQHINKNFDNDAQKDINSMDLVEDIISCTNSIASEASRIKSILTATKALQNSANMLQES
ncbi:uncharacterized protein LOC143217501 [Lasioglossum baleicum]|uniref:uncharacterized protein LOC143217501 n=1 Tax=Lasioglossum baleicum TaxID=434251 RepID=UPI003FCE81EC